MPLCGMDWWSGLMEKGDVADYRYLAIITGSSISILITYIVFVTKLQKRQTLEKGFALKKRYHRF